MYLCCRKMPPVTDTTHILTVQSDLTQCVPDCITFRHIFWTLAHCKLKCELLHIPLHIFCTFLCKTVQLYHIVHIVLLQYNLVTTVHTLANNNLSASGEVWGTSPLSDNIRCCAVSVPSVPI